MSNLDPISQAAAQTLPSDEQLTDFEREVMAQLEQREAQSKAQSGGEGEAGGDPSTASPESVPSSPNPEEPVPVIPEPEPEPESVTPESPEPTEPTVPDEGLQPEDQEPPAPEASEEDIYDFNGREVTDTELTSALEVRDYVEKLGPDANNILGAMASGQYVMVHQEDYNALMAAYQGQAQPSAQPSASGAPTPTQPYNPEEVADPEAHARIQKLEEEIRQQQQLDLQNQVRARQTAIEQATNDFKDKYNVPLDRLMEMRNEVISQQILPGIAAREGGDFGKAMERALEYVYKTAFESDYVQSKVQEELARQRATAERKQKASALSGSGGSVSKTAPPKPSTKEEKRSAMIAEVAEVLKGP